MAVEIMAWSGVNISVQYTFKFTRVILNLQEEIVKPQTNRTVRGVFEFHRTLRRSNSLLKVMNRKPA